ncbi:winged helix-turn-helix domain-containing protein [Pontibacterium sp. N1Y112]|uniref:Winged helix-turn-helix domain-containing protein n=1 Tax=Pontibacterium sinense TaxID=2781979 RepID=A0A8J7K6W2_9GAMM|nr:helix-turn-helix domain-containing protein [Pontibacterium sinense]MBE9397556.1 winged helix-turn-helix domain-containing protein [Pontibacterium sinense]
MEVSKQQRAFFRKLYLSHLISQEPLNVTALQKMTGMPRRTLQDTLKDLGDIGIECSFIQQEGGRNNAGYYQIDCWGPIDPSWINKNLARLEAVLEISV